MESAPAVRRSARRGDAATAGEAEAQAWGAVGAGVLGAPGAVDETGLALMVEFRTSPSPVSLRRGRGLAVPESIVAEEDGFQHRPTAGDLEKSPYHVPIGNRLNGPSALVRKRDGAGSHSQGWVINDTDGMGGFDGALFILAVRIGER